MKQRSCCLVVVLLAGAGDATGQDAPRDGRKESKRVSTARTIKLDFQINALIDMHCMVRAMAGGTAGRDDGAPQLAGLSDALAAVKQTEAELGTPPVWGMIVGTLLSFESAGDAIEPLGGLLEQLRLRDGRTIRVRDCAMRLARVYQGLEPAFLKEAWPRRRSALQEQEQRIERAWSRKLSECLAFSVHKLGMAEPSAPVPICLVTQAPPPHAMTYRRAGGAVCIVAASQFRGTQLAEVIVHEATHALDSVNGPPESVMRQISDRLMQAGLTWRDRDLRNLPHTVMFVHAAEMIRRFVDPQHKDYGEVAGYYAKVPASAAAIRPHWKRYLDGELTRNDVVDRIVSDFLKSRKAAGG